MFFASRFFHRFDDQNRDAIRAQIDDLMRDRSDGDWLLRSRVTNQTNEYVLVVRYGGQTFAA
jgi:hypothetical protein